MSNIQTQFKKGQIPWNKGKKGLQVAWNKGIHSGIPKSAWKKGMNPLMGMLGKKHKLESIAKQKASHSTMEYKNKARIWGNIGVQKQQNMKEPTSIEKAVYDYLLLKGILFEKQKLINGKFLVDAYIPSLNLIIEADGNYWHTLDRVQKKDKAENAYLKKCGFNLTRLSETEINNGNFKERLVV